MRANLPAAMAVGNTSKDSLLRSKDNEEMSPLKGNQVIDVKQANLIAHKKFLLQNISNDSPNASMTKLHRMKFKGKKQKAQNKRMTKMNAVLSDNIEEAIKKAKDDGYNELYYFPEGMYFKYNDKMKDLGENFINFPWENYNHDDFLSYMLTHNKRVNNYLDFYKNHAKHSHFLRTAIDDSDQTEVHVLRDHTKPIHQVIINESGNYIITASSDGKIGIWDYEQRVFLHFLEGHLEPVTCIAITKDDKSIISGSRDRTLRVWSLETFAEKGYKSEAHADWLNALLLFREDKNIITAGNDKVIKIWDIDIDINTAPLVVLKGHEDGVLSLALTPDEKILFSGSDDTTIRVWSMETNQELDKCLIDGHYDGVNALCVTTDKSSLVSGSEDGYIMIWDLKTFEYKISVEDHSSDVHSLYVTKNSKYIVSGHKDKTIKIWDIATGTEKKEIEGHSESINSVIGSFLNDYVISGSDDNTIRVTKLGINEDGQVLYCHDEKVNCLVICPNGESIITAGDDNIKVYSLILEKFLGEIGSKGASPIEVLTITFDGQFFLAGNKKGEIMLYSLSELNLIRTYHGHGDAIYALKVSMDGKTIFSGAGDFLVGIWEIGNERKWRSLAGHKGEVRCLAVGKDQKTVYSGSVDKTIKVWDIVKSVCLYSLEGHEGSIHALAISYEKRRLFSGSSDQTIKVWNLDTHSEVKEKTMYGHTDEVMDLHLSKDSKFLYSGSKDKTMRVWHVDLGRIERIIEGHDADVKGVRVTVDKQFIISASYDRTVRNWVNEVKDENEQIIMEGHNDNVNKSCLNKSNKYLISCSADKNIKVWDFEKSIELWTLSKHKGSVNWITQSRMDDNILYSVGEDGCLKVWDIEKGEELQDLTQSGPISSLTLTNNNKFLFLGLEDSTILQFSIQNPPSANSYLTFLKTFPKEHTGKINQLNVTKNDQRLVSVSVDSYIIIWNISSQSCEKKILSHKGPVLSVTSTNKVKNIISGGDDCLIKIWDIETGREKIQIKGHNKPVFALFLTPDDKKLLSGSEDNTIRIWRVKTGEQLNIILGHLGTVRNICLDKDAKRIISSSNDKTIRIQDMPDSEKELILRGHTNAVNCVVLSPDNKTIYTGSSDNSIKSWDFETGKQEKKFMLHTGAVLGLYLSSDGNLLFSSSQDKTVVKWDVNTEKMLQVYPGHRSPVFSVILDYEEKHVISASDDKTIRVWRIDDVEGFREFEGHKAGVTCICLSVDGYYMFSGSLDKTIRKWNIETAVSEQTLQDNLGHMGGVKSICSYNRSSTNYLVSGGDDMFVRVWNVELGCVELIFEGHKNHIFSVVVDYENNFIISCGKDRTIRIWNLENGQEAFVYTGHLNGINGLAITSDDRHIVSVSKDQTIRIWRFLKDERYHEIEGHDKSVADLAICPDNKYLISASYDATIRVWNMETLNEERVLYGHTKAVRCLKLFHTTEFSILFSGSSDHNIKVWNWTDSEKPELLTLEKKHHEAILCLALDPSGFYMASGSSDNSIILWEFPDFSETKTLNELVEKLKDMSTTTFAGHKKTVNCLGFSLNGLILASGDAEGLIYLWEVYAEIEPNKPYKILDSHCDFISDLCFTKDSKRLISGGKDMKIRVWDIETGKEQRILIGHEGPIYSVVLSKDETHVFSGSDDFTVKLWNLETGFCEQTLEGHEDLITSIIVCKDGKRIVTASEDESIRVWWVFDPNFSIVSLMIEMLEMHSDDNKIAKMYPKFKDHVFSESIFPFHFSILHYYAYLNDSLAIERIVNILDILENKHFILTTDLFGRTPIDVAFDNKNKRILNALFTYAMNRPPPMNGFPNFLEAFQKAIEFNLLNLEKIFDSRLIPLKQCLPSDDQRFTLPEECKMTSEINTHAFNHYCIETKSLEEAGLIVDDGDDITNRVEFFILDIPYIVDFEKNELFSEFLHIDSNSLLFSSEALQAILHYKWKRYASFSYARDLIVFCIFLLTVTINSVFLFPNRIKESLDETRRENFKVGSIILNIIMAVFTGYFILSELHKWKCFGTKLYFSTVWHTLELIILSILCATICLDLSSISGIIVSISWLKALLSINIFLLYIKFLSYARGYKQTAFMVRMILQVIYDIKVFLAIFFILVISIGFSIFVLQESDGVNDANIIAQFSIFNMVYRMILGDNQLYDNVAVSNNYIHFLLWIFFFITTLFMMIIMLNLLISILGDSYDKISGREVLANNYEKTWILYEIDSTLSNVRKKILRKKNVFEKYLVAAKIKDELIDENQNERLRKKIDRIEEKIDGIEEKFKEINRKIREKNEYLEAKIDKNHGNLETLIDNMQEKICTKIDSLDKGLIDRKRNIKPA